MCSLWLQNSENNVSKVEQHAFYLCIAVLLNSIFFSDVI